MQEPFEVSSFTLDFFLFFLLLNEMPAPILCFVIN